MQNELAKIIIAFLVAALWPCTSSLARTQTFSTPGHDQVLESGSASDTRVPAQTPVKKSATVPTLNDLASELEDVARLAAKGQLDPVENSLHAVTAAVNKLKGVASDQIYRNLFDRIADMSEAKKNNDFEGIALAAAEGYRAVRLAQDPVTLPSPIELYMLDYTGLKTDALSGADSPDWYRLAAIGKETSNYWAALSSKTNDSELRNLMDTIIAGFKVALDQNNVTELKIVTKLQFEAVAILKREFTKKES